MDETEDQIQNTQRPFFLSILCFSVFVYSVVFILIFLFSIIFHNWVFIVLNDFLPGNGIDKQVIFYLSITGALLYIGSFIGALFMWKMKRSGYFIYALSTIFTISLPYLFGYGSLINLISLSVLVLGFSFYIKLMK